MADSALSYQDTKQLLLEKEFNRVIDKATEIIESDSNGSDKTRFLVLRAEAYFSTEEYTDCLTDIKTVLDATATTEISTATKFDCNLIKGKCLIGLEEYESAHSALAICRSINVSDLKSLRLINECKAKLNLQLEIEPEACTVGKKPVRHEFYQTDSQVVISILAKKVNKKDISVECDGNQLSVSATLSNLDDYSLSIALYNPVIASKVRFNVSPAKIEITLTKTAPFSWPKLEKDTKLDNNDAKSFQQGSTSMEVQNPQKFPSSAKKTCDWDKLEAEIKKEESEEKPEGDAAVNQFFKQIYGQGSEDQKRAMMKSFQESNGTVLSTNWDEIGKGPVETKAPDGMEFKKYEY